MIISTSNKLYDANNKCLYNSGKGGVWVTWKYVKKNQQRVGIYPISGIMPMAEYLQFCDMIFLMHDKGLNHCIYVATNWLP